MTVVGMFHFKHFDVEDDRSTMKVGTDAVLLGSLVETGNACSVLDIGTGCGVIALIMAQRFPEANIEAIDIDRSSVEQAKDNFEQSAWASNMDVQWCCLRDFVRASVCRFDLIVSNPPFFENSLKGPVESRNNARHADALTFDELLYSVKSLLSESGEFWCILPFESAKKMITVAPAYSLYPSSTVSITMKELATPKRMVFSLKHQKLETIRQSYLTIRNSENEYSDAYRTLTQDLYVSLK